jgi:hypothetical protein
MRHFLSASVALWTAALVAAPLPAGAAGKLEETTESAKATGMAREIAGVRVARNALTYPR